MRKKLVGALAGFLAVMLVFTILSRAADSVGIPRVSTDRAGKKVIGHPVSAAGKIEQNQEQAVFTEANQRVKAIHVNEGQQVEEGELLFELDMEELEDQILTAKEELEKKKLQRQDTISSKEVSAANKANSRANAEIDYQNAIDAADAAIQQAKDKWDAAKQALKNYKKSGTGDSGEDSVAGTLQKTCNEKKAAYENAVGEREATEQEINEKIQAALKENSETSDETKSGSGSDPLTEKEIEAQIRAQYQAALDMAIQKEETALKELQAAEAALDEYKQNQAASAAASQQTTKEQLKQQAEEARIAYEQAVQDKETQVNNAAKGVRDANLADASNHSDQVESIGIDQDERNLKKLEKLKEWGGKILSPVKGVVSKVFITTGDRTTDGTAVLLADISSGLRFTAQIPVSQEKYIARLDEVILKPDNNGKDIQGLTVDTISTNSEDPGLLDVTVQIPENALEIGAGATMKVNKKSEPYEICVPLSALYKEDNQYYLFVVEGTETILGTEQTVRRLDVTVIDQNSEYAALENGSVTTEQDIVTDSEKLLEAGDRVRLNES